MTKPGTGENAMEHRLESAGRALSEVRARRTTSEIGRVLSAAAERWRRPEYAPRRHAVRELATSNRVEPAMLETALDCIFGAVTTSGIEKLLQREVGEVGDLAALEPAAGVARRHGPRLAYFANAGNLPGQAVPVLVCAALARTAVVVRESARQPGMTAAFVDSIRETDGLLADTFVVIEGLRGNENETAVRNSGRIEVSGSDSTVAELASRYRTVAGGEIVEHGTRTSAAVIAQSADFESAARGTALDAAIYEGRGCLAPQVVYVEGDSARARRFAETLAGAFADREAHWPRRKQSLEEEAARRSFIDAAELAALADADRAIFQGEGGTWCVALGPAPDPEPGPGHRCIRVVATENRRATLKRLTNGATPLAGIAVGGEELEEAAESLRAAGATLVCAPGELAKPPLYWRQDGRSRLEALLTAGETKER